MTYCWCCRRCGKQFETEGPVVPPPTCCGAVRRDWQREDVQIAGAATPTRNR